MSLFSKIAPSLETEEQLQARYQRLCAYAAVYHVKDFDEDVLESDIAGGLTSAKLDNLERLMKLSATVEKFTIDSTDRLDWFLKKRLLINAELEGVKAQYKKLIGMLESEDRALDYLYKDQAEAFALAEYQRTGKKTLVLPHGTAAVRTEKPAWKLESEELLQEWLEKLENKAEYDVKPKVWTRNLAKLKEAAADGMYIDGLKRDEGGYKVSLRLPKELG